MNGEQVTGIVPIVLVDGLTIYNATVDYWPLNDPYALAILVSGANVFGGEPVAELDTTLLQNGSYGIRVTGTDEGGSTRTGIVMVTVSGEYKPGRVRFTVTDLTIPVTGLPITIGRTYDSLERNESGDFGYGWSLAIGNPKLKVDPAHNVTLTMPDGKRSTFYFSPVASGGVMGFLYTPRYLPETGVFGSLVANGCGVLTISGGQYYCFPGGPYQESISGYTYTDPYGRKYEISVNGTLESITDLNGNTLTFSPDGITSSTGLIVSFVRDNQGRIVQIIDPETNTLQYEYDDVSNLVKVTDVEGGETEFTYNDDHYLLDIIDPGGTTVAKNEYDENGRLVSTTDSEGNTYIFEHDLNIRRETVTNRLGKITIYEYDDSGNVIKKIEMTDSGNLETSWEYDNNGNVIKETLPNNAETIKEYDGKGNLIYVRNPLQHETKYTYDQYRNVETVEDALENITRHEYDPNTGKKLTTYDVLENIVDTYTYDSYGNLKTHTSNSGKMIEFAYDQHGNQIGTISRWVNPDNPDDIRTVTTASQYDNNNRITMFIDPEGNETSYNYDNKGNLTSLIDQFGQETNYIYDVIGHQIQVTYPDNTITRTVYDGYGREKASVERHIPGEKTFGALTFYDAEGNVTRVQTVEDIVIEIDTTGSKPKSILSSPGNVILEINNSYNNLNQLIETENTEGTKTSYEYNILGQQSAVIDTYGNRTEYEYNTGGQLILKRDPLNRETQYEYDKLGRRIKTIYQDNTTIEKNYDPLGRCISQTDQSGKIREFEYNPSGQLTAVIMPAVADPEAGNVLIQPTYKYTYNPDGTLKMITDPKGRETIFTYDQYGQMLSCTLPLGQIQSTEYDKFKRVSRQIDFKDQVTEFLYGSFGQISQKNLYAAGADTPDETVEFIYDEMGKQVKMIESRGITEYIYNDQGNLIELATPEGSIHYAYDPANGQKIRTWTDYTDVRYDYDLLGRLKDVTLVERNGEILDEPEITHYEYTSVGSRESIIFPNGIIARYIYTDKNYLETITYTNSSGTILASYNYSLSPDGRHTGVTETFIDSENNEISNTISYTYDNLNRITKEAMSATDNSYGYEVEYIYDLAGNRLERKVTIGTQLLTTTYTYDDNDRLLTENNTTRLIALANPMSIGITGIGTGILRPLPTKWNWFGFLLLMIGIPIVILLFYFIRFLLILWNNKKVNIKYKLSYRTVSVLLVYLFLIGPVNFQILAQKALLYTTLTTNNWGQESSTTTYEYDENGSLIRKQITGQEVEISEYTYNLENRLNTVNITKEIDGNIRETTLNYLYNQSGIRVGKHIRETVNGTLMKDTTIHFLIDPFNPTGIPQVLEERTAVDVPPLATYTIGDDILSQATEANMFGSQYLLYDGHGSTRQLANTTGNIDTCFSYDAYGVMLLDNSDSSSPTATNLLYSGERYDADLGQYYLRARYYDQQNGRFNRLDPYGGNKHEPQSFHKYTYCYGDPVNNVDPSGKTALKTYLRALVITTTVIGALWGLAQPAATPFNRIMNMIPGAFLGYFAGTILALCIASGFYIAASLGFTWAMGEVFYEASMILTYQSVFYPEYKPYVNTQQSTPSVSYDEAKSKIHGSPHDTKTTGHWFRSNRIALRWAKKPEVSDVWLNRTIKTATGHPIPGRPDVIVKLNNGRYIFIEVPSNSDLAVNSLNLWSRMIEVCKQMPQQEVGGYLIEKITQ